MSAASACASALSAVVTCATLETPALLSTASSSRMMAGSSSTISTRSSSIGRRFPRAESHPRKFFPVGLAPPRVPQPPQAPVHGELAEAEVLHDGVGQENEDVAPPLEGQQPPLHPVRQADPELPRPHQHGQDVDQNAVTERREEECPGVLPIEEVEAEHAFRDQEQGDEDVPGEFDDRA